MSWRGVFACLIRIVALLTLAIWTIGGFCFVYAAGTDRKNDPVDALLGLLFMASLVALITAGGRIDRWAKRGNDGLHI